MDNYLLEIERFVLCRVNNFAQKICSCRTLKNLF